MTDNHKEVFLQQFTSSVKRRISVRLQNVLVIALSSKLSTSKLKISISKFRFPKKFNHFFLPFEIRKKEKNKLPHTKTNQYPVAFFSPELFRTEEEEFEEEEEFDEEFDEEEEEEDESQTAQPSIPHDYRIIQAIVL